MAAHAYWLARAALIAFLNMGAFLSHLAAASPPPTPITAAAQVPTSWQATATCEEGGRDDPNYGYFGIIDWGGFDGYPNAGAAPLSVQLAWESAHGQDPPDAPGQCHSY